MRFFSAMLPVFAAMLFASSEAMAADDKVTLDFANADVESVVKAVSQLSGRNFLIDPRVKGIVNVVSGKPVPRDLAYQILVSALRLQGFAVIEQDGIAKIVPESDAKVQAGPVGKPSHASGQVITQVFQIRHESAQQLVNAIKPLVANNNSISTVPGNNVLIITDYADNIRRIEKIIEALDVPVNDEPEIIPVRHASAVDIAGLLNRLFAEGAGSPGGATDVSQRLILVADGRTNSLILRSGNPARKARVRSLLQTLDQPTAVQGNIHVVPIRHAEATRIAQTVRAILGGETASSAVTPSSSSAQTAAGSGAGLSPMSVPLSPAGQVSGIVSGSIVQADAATNSLIITAPDPIYKNLRHVIDQLDRRRPQVLIEAIVAELSADKASEFGIQWQNVSGGNSARLVGGTNFGSGGKNIVGVLENAAKAPVTGTLGLPPGLNVGVIKGISNGVPVIPAMLRVLETDNNANILSTPSIMTLDNEEAKIIIGQNVPFITGSYAQSATATTPTPFQTYERKDVGISLKVRPQITEGGVVRIQIYQEASSVQPNSVSNAAGPITNKRALESSVLVDDGSIIVLGGLIDDNFGTGEDKVPILGDIPLFGGLFRYETRKRTKTNLMVFLRPTIVRDPADYHSLTSHRYGEIGTAQKNFEDNRRAWYGDTVAPRVPPLPDKK